jgi:uncharacterized protein (TIGR03067 family)
MEAELLDPARAKVEAARRDRDRLQGSWVFVSGTREAQLQIAGDQFTMRFRTGDVYSGTLLVDPTHKPRAMDLLIAEGPERHRGKTALAIYEFDGDHLIWCPAEPGHCERLRAFPPDGHRGHLCLIFRREKVHPPAGK